MCAIDDLYNNHMAGFFGDTSFGVGNTDIPQTDNISIEIPCCALPEILGACNVRGDAQHPRRTPAKPRWILCGIAEDCQHANGRISRIHIATKNFATEYSAAAPHLPSVGSDEWTQKTVSMGEFRIYVAMYIFPMARPAKVPSCKSPSFLQAGVDKPYVVASMCRNVYMSRMGAPANISPGHARIPIQGWLDNQPAGYHR